GPENLQITRELEPRDQMDVVEQFELVLDLEAATDRQEIEVVFQHVTQVGVPVGHAELVTRTIGKETVAAQTDVEERRDRTGRLIGKGELPEESPPVSCRGFDEVLPEGVVHGP